MSASEKLMKQDEKRDTKFLYETDEHPCNVFIRNVEADLYQV